MSIANTCPKCNARPYQACRSSSGKSTNQHAARANGQPAPSRITGIGSEGREIAQYHNVHQDSWFPHKVESPTGLSSRTDASESDLDDAIRYVRNLEMGLSDDTLDPATIIRDLLDWGRARWSDDDIGERNGKIQSLEDECEDLKTKLTAMTKERDAALAERDDVEMKLDKSTSNALHWEREAIKARDKVCAMAIGNREINACADRAMAHLDATDAILKRLGL